MALLIITDYLTNEMTTRLLQEYPYGDNLSSQSSVNTSAKRKTDWEEALELEKETAAIYSMPKKTAAISTTDNKQQSSGPSKVATKTLVKPPTGVKSITSFFAKK